MIEYNKILKILSEDTNLEFYSSMKEELLMTTKDLWTTQPLCKERRLIRQLVYEGFKPGSVNPYDLRHIWAKSFCTNCDSYKPFDGRPVDLLNDETRGGIYAVKAAYEEGRVCVVDISLNSEGYIYYVDEYCREIEIPGGVEKRFDICDEYVLSTDENEFAERMTAIVRRHRNDEKPYYIICYTISIMYGKIADILNNEKADNTVLTVIEKIPEYAQEREKASFATVEKWWKSRQRKFKNTTDKRNGKTRIVMGDISEDRRLLTLCKAVDDEMERCLAHIDGEGLSNANEEKERVFLRILSMAGEAEHALKEELKRRGITDMVPFVTEKDHDIDLLPLYQMCYLTLYYKCACIAAMLSYRNTESEKERELNKRQLMHDYLGRHKGIDIVKRKRADDDEVCQLNDNEEKQKKEFMNCINNCDIKNIWINEDAKEKAHQLFEELWSKKKFVDIVMHTQSRAKNGNKPNPSGKVSCAKVIGHLKRLGLVTLNKDVKKVCKEIFGYDNANNTVDSGKNDITSELKDMIEKRFHDKK